MSLDTANTVFTVLTFVANVAFVVLVVVGIAALMGAGGRRLAGRVVSAIGTRARPAALVVAAVTTTGSLYYSEVKGLIPCELCWYQRIVMYPLVMLLVVGLLRRDKAVFCYAAPFVVIGAPLALYHWLVERVSWFTSSTSCSTSFVACNIPYFQKLGYITLAFMDLSAFLLIGALLTVGRAHDRATMKAA
jgi:disulfide bond formation protein DsbB